MKILLPMLGAFIFISTPIYANDIEGPLSELREKKKTMLSQAMQLTDDQKDTFWTVYADYEKEMESIIEDEFELIQKYNAKQENNDISEQSASNMSAQNFRIQGREMQIKQIYLGKFQEVLPKNVVLRFYLLDNKINALLDDDIAKIMPLTGTEMYNSDK